MKKAESKYFNTAVKMDKALITLLAQKDFQYITVKEICQCAGVNRSTFYLHYENTRDLLEETGHYLIDRFLSYFTTTENFQEILQAKDTDHLIFISEDYLYPYLQYFRENHNVLKHVLHLSEYFQFDTIYQRMFRYIFSPILEQFQFPDEQKDYVMRFYLSGIHAVISQWLNNDCRESNEEISRIIRKCILG